MADVLVTDDGWKVEQVSVIRGAGPARLLLRVTHYGYMYDEYETLEALRAGLPEGVFARLRPRTPPPDTEQ